MKGAKRRVKRAGLVLLSCLGRRSRLRRTTDPAPEADDERRDQDEAGYQQAKRAAGTMTFCCSLTCPASSDKLFCVDGRF
jgi:hypothetical protein